MVERARRGTRRRVTDALRRRGRVRRQRHRTAGDYVTHVTGYLGAPIEGKAGEQAEAPSLSAARPTASSWTSAPTRRPRQQSAPPDAQRPPPDDLGGGRSLSNQCWGDRSGYFAARSPIPPTRHGGLSGSLGEFLGACSLPSPSVLDEPGAGAVVFPLGPRPPRTGRPRLFRLPRRRRGNPEVYADALANNNKKKSGHICCRSRGRGGSSSNGRRGVRTCRPRRRRACSTREGVGVGRHHRRDVERRLPALPPRDDVPADRHGPRVGRPRRSRR